MQGGQIDRLFMIYKNNSLKERRTDMAAISIDGTPMTALPSDADQINYDNTSSGMAATQVQAAVDELNSNKQPKTDNNLQTTSKETTGAINELKSVLTKQVENITTGSFGQLNVMRCASVESISVEYAAPKENMTANAWVDVAVVSSNYRPSAERYLSAYVTGANGSAICSARVSIKPDGTIRFCPGAAIAKNTTIFWIVTFIV